ncbi:23S rRNA (pseudouridine(1915)-N(3))-methyltransferase RlmH, partial [Listeria monocytogenes]|uniref:23S rRNA (pseudouridine(1915)-N(3))-methyltransferase RlmH n=1 Tax=Listeria monocytogenes TaxID=1639 RepID=UPI003D7D5EB1
MKFFILAVGNKMPDWIRTGYLEYIKRLPGEITVNLIEIKPEKRAGGKTVVQ